MTAFLYTSTIYVLGRWFCRVPGRRTSPICLLTTRLAVFAAQIGVTLLTLRASTSLFLSLWFWMAVGVFTIDLKASKHGAWRIPAPLSRVATLIIGIVALEFLCRTELATTKPALHDVAKWINSHTATQALTAKIHPSVFWSRALGIFLYLTESPEDRPLRVCRRASTKHSIGCC